MAATGRHPQPHRRLLTGSLGTQLAHLLTAVLLLVVPAACAQATDGAAGSGAAADSIAADALEQLTRTADLYRSLDHYYFESRATVEMMTGAERRETEIRQRMAQQGRGRMFMEMQGPALQLQFISDGQQTWVVQPAAEQYTVRPGAPASIDLPEILQSYQQADQRLRAASILGSDTVTMADGTERAVVRIAATYDAPDDPGATTVDRLLWIEPATGLVLRDEASEVLTNPFTGERGEVQQTTVFSTADLGATLPDSLFRYTPSPSAEQVAPEVLFGQAPASLEGQPAPAFTLETLDGDTVSLADYEGSVVLINFWATWCGPCRMEMPVLEELFRAYYGPAFQVLAINQSEPAEDARAYIDQAGYTFPVLLDTDGRVSEVYRVLSLPTSFVVGADGTVVRQLVGARAEPEFREALQAAGIE